MNDNTSVAALQTPVERRSGIERLRLMASGQTFLASPGMGFYEATRAALAEYDEVEKDRDALLGWREDAQAAIEGLEKVNVSLQSQLIAARAQSAQLYRAGCEAVKERDELRDKFDIVAELTAKAAQQAQRAVDVAAELLAKNAELESENQRLKARITELEWMADSLQGNLNWGS